MVRTTFYWPHGGQQVFVCGSFSRWVEHYPMTLGEGIPPVFQATCNLPPGLHQYRFLVDGNWRIDEQQPFLSDDNGMVNNAIFIVETHVSSSVASSSNHLPPEQVAWISDTDIGVSRLWASPPNHPPPEQAAWISDADIGVSHLWASPSNHLTLEQPAWISDTDLGVSRLWVSRLLSNGTIYDILPMSSKLSIIDVQLPVKHAFHIMYEEGLPVVPLWDDSRSSITGMLTASDFILILKELQNNVRMLADEELEKHSVTAWKEIKLQLHMNTDAPVGPMARPLIHVSDLECLKDVVLKIVRNGISSVPIIRSSLQDGSFMPLLNLASLPGILKYICSHFAEAVGSVPFLHYPISMIPLGTWLPGGRFIGSELAILRKNAPLRSAFDLLLGAKVSSIPIVDDNGSLIDLYSRSDIMYLARGDTYARIQLDQMTIEQALEQVNQADLQINGRRRCHTCVRSNSLLEILERLSHPGVRRLVVIDANSRRVEGIISLRDVFTFLHG